MSSPATRISPFPTPERRRRERSAKREAILDTALALFLEQGYHHVTLNQVAERLHITKPALYNYFAGKTEILFACWMAGFEHAAAGIERIAAGPGDGLTRLRALIRAYGLLMTTPRGRCLIRFDDNDFTPEQRDRISGCKKQVDAAFRGWIAAGIEDGSIRPCDPKMAAFMIGGALNWIGQWHRDDGPMSPEAVVEDFAERLTTGLATR
ncbi:TetR/AcrR family transcriptional regulator [uncultured Albimonas sp.]|uniref:TetR/AcrR family transcriptional regulator n=1 Tax=uncultured Albimonas sp. TaxID=1331701 RepID=UPI0030EBD723|tara:strand:+ start:1326 stop:1952 length:627 start_codon:yes stop_codon:yes gene_type:complete